jgi:hypothetical protein
MDTHHPRVALLPDRVRGTFEMLPRRRMSAWAIDFVVVLAPLASALAAAVGIRLAVSLAERRERARGERLLTSVDSG